MQDLLKYSRNQKGKADKIIKDSNLIKILEEYGVVHIVGSYALDLMYRPEIDIWVARQEHNYKKARSLFKEIFENDYFDMLCFVKAIGTTFEKKVSGYYIQPHKNIGKEDWKIDVWLTTKEVYKPKYKKVLNAIEKSDDPTRIRNLILNLKNQFRSGSKYKSKLSADDFYKTVLDNPLLKFDELVEIIERNSRKRTT